MAAKRGNLSDRICKWNVHVDKDTHELLEGLGILPSDVLSDLVERGASLSYSVLSVFPQIYIYFRGYPGRWIYHKWSNLWTEDIYITYMNKTSVKLDLIRTRTFYLDEALHPTPDNFRDNISPPLPTLPYWFRRLPIDTETLTGQVERSGIEWAKPLFSAIETTDKLPQSSLFMIDRYRYNSDHENQDALAQKLLIAMTDGKAAIETMRFDELLPKYIEGNIEEEELIFTKFAAWWGKSEPNLQGTYLAKSPYLRETLKAIFPNKRKEILERRKRHQVEVINATAKKKSK